METIPQRSFMIFLTYDEGQYSNPPPTEKGNSFVITRLQKEEKEFW